jgi:hypothetical protein
MNLHPDPVEADDHHACYQPDPALQAEQIRQLGEFEEGDKGTLEVGKLADIAALDHDLLTAPEDTIPHIHAALVVVDGAVVLEPAPPRAAPAPLRPASAGPRAPR